MAPWRTLPIAAEPVAAPAPRRLTPAGEVASHPAWSPDGNSIAYVRTTRAGEEIWTVDPAGASPHRRVAAEELKKAGLAGSGYTLDDLAWSPAGDRIAFTWLSESWGQIAISDTSGAIALVPPPVVEDPWIEGSSFRLSASSFVWDASGLGGTFIGWDDDCGSIYRASIPASGAWSGPAAAKLPLSDACRTRLRGAIGGWVFTELNENLLPRIVLVDASGKELDSMVFPQGAAPRVTFGRGSGPRLPVAGWWDDAERSERMLFVWSAGKIAEWARLHGVGEGGDVIAISGGPLLYLEGSPGASPLMRLDAPGGSPREIFDGPIVEFRVSPDGGRAVVVRRGGLWVIDITAGGAISGGAQPPLPG